MFHVWQPWALSSMNSGCPGQSRLLCIKRRWPGSLPSSCIRVGCYWGLAKAMLAQLVSLLENKQNGLSIAEISRCMNAQPSAVMSMIGLLVQKGKLIEIGPDGKCCTACGLESECNLLAARGKRYSVAPRTENVQLIRL